MEKSRVTSQTIIVTGASSGIGLVVARDLAKQGHEVFGTSRKTQSRKEPFNWLQLDVNEPDSIDALITSVTDKTGRIDVLINNAGLGMISSFEEAPVENMNKVMDTNFGGVVRMTKAVLPQMRAQKSGKIINISSMAGLMGLAYRSFYSASKFAVEGLTESLRQEVRKFGIQVCSLQPGSINTDITAHRVSHIPNESAYNPEVQRVEDIINSEVGSGIDAQQVALTVHRIIETKKVKSKYVVAKPFQKLVVKLKRILPSALFEKMMMSHYEL